jgi:hypothetical protein
MLSTLSISRRRWRLAQEANTMSAMTYGEDELRERAVVAA